MVRKLQFHEKKLLKKVDFLSWQVDNNIHELKVMKKYCIQRREDYTLYNKLSKRIRELARSIKEMKQEHPRRIEFTRQLLEKLYSMGLIPTKKNLELADKITASTFCRRRLPMLMVRLNMAERMKTAVTFIEQGHVRIGPNVVDDPAYLVTRTMEDFITWKDSSKVKKHVQDYNDIRDDFDLS